MWILTLFISSCNRKKQQKKDVINIYENKLESETWETDQILGLDPNAKKYTLTKFIERKFAGNLTHFSGKSNFNSYYTSFCGNDNFRMLIGNYEFLDEDKVSISVDSISYSGEWKKTNEIRRKKELVYLISKTGSKIILRKQDE